MIIIILYFKCKNKIMKLLKIVKNRVTVAFQYMWRRLTSRLRSLLSAGVLRKSQQILTFCWVSEKGNAPKT